MSTFDVKVRNLETGETLIASLPDCDTCMRWTSQRPRNAEILSVLSDTSGADRDRLHAAMHPHDDAELMLDRKYDEARMAAAQEAYAAAMRQMEAEQVALESADSMRSMSIGHEAEDVRDYRIRLFVSWIRWLLGEHASHDA